MIWLAYMLNEKFYKILYFRLLLYIDQENIKVILIHMPKDSLSLFLVIFGNSNNNNCKSNIFALYMEMLIKMVYTD